MEPTTTAAPTLQPTPTPTLVSNLTNNLVPTPDQVYSPANVASAMNAPAARPDLSDPFGLYDFYLNTPEIQAARQALQANQGQIIQANQALRTTTRALENQNENAQGSTGASINLIGRQVGRARQLTADEIAALSEQQQVAQANLDTLLKLGSDRLSIAREERGRLQELIAATGGQAGISFTDTFESAVKKADKYIEKKAEKERDSEYKRALQRELILMGESTKTKKGGTLDIKGLEKKLQKLNKEAKDEAKKLADLKYQAALEEFNQLKNKASASSDWNEADYF